MGFFGDILSAFGGQQIGAQLFNLITDPIRAGMDSLGLSQHGRDQYFARELQWDMLNSQMNFQREMTANQQAFTKEMYVQQWQDMLQKYPLLAQRLNDQQFNLWKNQFDLQNAWNSPGHQMALQRAGGINPALQGALTASNSMGASSAQMPPQISPTPFSSHASPIGLPQGLSGRGTDIASVGSFLRDLASAKKQGVETDQLKKLFDYEVEERAQRIFGQRLVNDSISLDNYVKDRIKDFRVKHASQELLKLVAETENVEQDTSLKLEQMWKERSEFALNMAKKYLTDKEFEMYDFKVKNLSEEFRTTMANIRADTAKKVSETRLNNAIRETENQLRDGKVECQRLGNEFQRIGNELAYNDLWVSNRTLDAKVLGLMHSLEREGIITKQESERLYQMHVSSDWAERQQFIQYVGATATAFGNVLSGTGSAFSGVASWKNAQWNNLNYRERNQIMRDVGTERNRILDDYQKGVKDAKRSSILGPDWEMYSDQWSR